MKILQICLSTGYSPLMGYQDSIMPDYYCKIGLQTTVIASTTVREPGVNNVEVSSGVEYSLRGLKIIRLKYLLPLPLYINRKLGLFKGLSEAIKKEDPDIIFIHSPQFLSIIDIVRYLKKSKKRPIVYVDNHADYINSARNWFTKYVLGKIVFGYCARAICPYTKKFWGVTPLRCRFLHEMYSIPYEKIDLLVMGAETEKIRFSDSEIIRRYIRNKYDIAADDTLIISGGKFDRRKNLRQLLLAMHEINDPKVVLMIFGSLNDDVMKDVESLRKGIRLVNVGWVDQDKVYDYYLSADIGIFPGTHSVLWEQAVGSGLPCLFNDWDGFNHLDVGGNCIFVNGFDYLSIAEDIKKVLNDKEKLRVMKQVSIEKGVDTFSYLNITKKSIGYQEEENNEH